MVCVIDAIFINVGGGISVKRFFIGMFVTDQNTLSIFRKSTATIDVIRKGRLTPLLKTFCRSELSCLISPVASSAKRRNGRIVSHKKNGGSIFFRLRKRKTSIHNTVKQKLSIFIDRKSFLIG